MTKELNSLTQRTGNFVVIVLPVINILYFLWHFLTLGKIYWATYSRFSELWGLAILVGSLFFLIALLFSNIAFIWRLIITLATLVIMCLNTFALFWGVPYHITTIALGNHTYHLVYVANDNGGEYYRLLECNKNSVFCKYTPDELRNSGPNNRDMKLVGDDNENEVHIIKNGYLIYTYGNQSRHYVSNLDETKIGLYTYYLGYYVENWSVIYNLYKCDNKFSCAKMPFQYSTNYKSIYELEDAELQVNKITNEINVFFKSALIFTYGEHPRCYVEGCEILEPQ